MTTKLKIIFGFVLMIIITATMAAYGYVSLQDASNGFSQYRRLARGNVTISDMIASVNSAIARTYDFLDNENPSHIDSALNNVTTAKNLLAQAAQEAQKPDHQSRLQDIDRQLDTLKTNINSIRTSILDINRQFDSAVRPSYNTMILQLAELGQISYDRDNIMSLYSVSQLWDNFATCLTAISRFTDSRDDEDAKATEERFKVLSTLLADLGRQLHSEEGRRTFQLLSTAMENVTSSFAVMRQRAASVNTSIRDIHTLETDITKVSSELNTDIDTQMRAYGTATLEANDSSQRNLLITSGLGLLIGAILAVVIVFGIVHILRELSLFAGAVARGDFSHQIKSREKGEIGETVQAMRRIPEVFTGVIQESRTLTNNIMKGNFRERLEPLSLPGNFGELATCINSVSDAYTGILDALPVPLMACGKDFKVNFYNKAGQTVVGGNLTATPCRDNLKAPECSNDQCFGKRAMESGTTVNGETTVYPQGKRTDIAVSALPLRDMQGNMAGYLEIITDLTAIKEQQRTMQQVASQAAEISNRVAAASEQLSSQVEEISRGAELQRARVESTASAMTEMNATVLEVARSAGQASEQSENTRQKANEGAALVNQVVQAINTVNTVATSMQTNMHELGTQAESIGGVMNVISDIADQTNLLALNAAIEAARAGEAGRGFAVVADEVRKLAEKTMSATHEVGSNIKAIQHTARTNIDEMGNAAKSVTDATELAQSSGKALHEIVELASANSSVVASIATAAEEQSATSEEINRAVDEINQVVGETSEGMLQSAEAVQELSRMAQELRIVMDQLK